MRPNFDAKSEIENVVKWIKHWFIDNGENASAVIGLSGGKDSTIIAKLLTMALGKDRVVGVLMPNGEQKDIDDAIHVAELLGIKYYIINIEDAVNGLTNQLKAFMPVSYDTAINIPPRVRMTTLYSVAQSLPNGGRVVNTCNFSEDYVGYCTKFGDSAGDFAPCADFFVSEMVAMGDALDLPYELVHKTPSDGLCGKSDEDNLGFSYDDIEEFITNEDSNPASKDKIIRLHEINAHKFYSMPYYYYDDYNRRVCYR